ncbi:MAG: hypothetical protein HY747_12580 [Elusimicrobia bacterium]|nr:hypothetical protein [Elusimicrobiota bacterium]
MEFLGKLFAPDSVAQLAIKVYCPRLSRWVMWWGIPGTTTLTILGIAPF